MQPGLTPLASAGRLARTLGHTIQVMVPHSPDQLPPRQSQASSCAVHPRSGHRSPNGTNYIASGALAAQPWSPRSRRLKAMLPALLHPELNYIASSGVAGLLPLPRSAKSMNPKPELSPRYRNHRELAGRRKSEKAVSQASIPCLRQCGLTLRSSGAPTAGRQAQGAALWHYLHPGLSSCRRRPLSSNVRPQNRGIVTDRHTLTRQTFVLALAAGLTLAPLLALNLRGTRSQTFTPPARISYLNLHCRPQLPRSKNQPSCKRSQESQHQTIGELFSCRLRLHQQLLTSQHLPPLTSHRGSRRQSPRHRSRRPVHHSNLMLQPLGQPTTRARAK